MMNDCDLVQRMLRRELQTFRRELELFPDDETVWQTVPGVTNSAGNLALHVAGNLQYFIGAVLGGTGYTRDREREFGLRSGTRRELIGEIDAALRVVDDVFPRIPADRLESEFPEAVAGVRLPTGVFLFHLATHAAFHLGQAGYLRRALTGNAASSGGASVAALAR